MYVMKYMHSTVACVFVYGWNCQVTPRSPFWLLIILISSSFIALHRESLEGWINMIDGHLTELLKQFYFTKKRLMYVSRYVTPSGMFPSAMAPTAHAWLTRDSRQSRDMLTPLPGSIHSRGDRHPMPFLCLFWWCNACDICFIFCKHGVYCTPHVYKIWSINPMHCIIKTNRQKAWDDNLA